MSPNTGAPAPAGAPPLTGGPPSPFTQAGNTFSAMGGVASNYGKSVQAVFAPLGPPDPNNPGQTVPFGNLPTGQQAAILLRRGQQAAGAIAGILSVGQDMLDVGFANLTAPLAALFPALPSATMTSLYMGIPHAHAHPPSLIPPAPVGVPLPSLGPIVVGICVRVLLGGKPAARIGDIGVAPTCGGLAPYFKVFLASSNVFIGGKRAARITDICRVCTKVPKASAGGAAGALAAAGKVASAVSSVIHVAGKAAQVLGMAADLAEAASDPSPAMAAAKAMNAAMTAAQMAADAAAAAVEGMMGTDPSAPSQPVGIGAVLVPGAPTVMIGGFPMIQIPNPAGELLNALKKFKPQPPPEGEEAATGAGG